jgi:hypothetical protein
VAYEREAMVLRKDAFIAVDFALPARRKAIEVNGKVQYDQFFDHPSYPGIWCAAGAAVGCWWIH